MIKILFIDDEPDSVKAVEDYLQDGTEDYDCVVTDFADTEKAILWHRPDIIVLDICLKDHGAGNRGTPGLQAYNLIRKDHFCPIVAFSAYPDSFPDENTLHPLIAKVQKGTKGPIELKTVIDAFRPQIAALHEARRAIDLSFSTVMREVAPRVFANIHGAAERAETIVRAGRRRIAALMNSMAIEGSELLASWEQYLIPPIDGHVNLGDILMKVGGSSDEPTDFRLVLTPSCDMVNNPPDRLAKVTDILVAQCKSSNELLKGMCLGGATVDTLKKKLPEGVLNTGYHRNHLPLPAVESCIPCMTADLREIELIPLQDVIGTDKCYERIASIDSPFREMVSWAYLQIACRPGLPDRNTEPWCEQIFAAQNVAQGGQNAGN